MLAFSYSLGFNTVLSHVNFADIRHIRSSRIIIPFFWLNHLSSVRIEQPNFQVLDIRAFTALLHVSIISSDSLQIHIKELWPRKWLLQLQTVNMFFQV